MKATFRIAAAQMYSEKWAVDRNLQHAETFVQRAARAGAEFILFPEYFNTGTSGGSGVEGENRRRFSEPLNGRTFKWMARHADHHGIYVAGGILEQGQDGVYNAILLVSPRGELAGTFRKLHTMGEETPGDAIPVIPTELATFGCMICYDHRFPEVARIAALKGAEVILHPTHCNGRIDPLYEKNTTIRARAAENGCYVVAANGAQGDGQVGNTQIVGPYCDRENRNDIVLAIASDWEDLVVADLTRDRYTGPPGARRPELYGDLCAIRKT